MSERRGIVAVGQHTTYDGADDAVGCPSGLDLTLIEIQRQHRPPASLQVLHFRASNGWLVGCVVAIERKYSNQAADL